MRDTTVQSASGLTLLLEQWQNGDQQAHDTFDAHIYASLKNLARSQLSKEPHDNLIKPTMLVHEAFMKIQSAADGDCQNRHHYIAMFVGAMRQVLVDMSRRRQARGYDKQSTVTVRMDDTESNVVDVLDMDHALNKLMALNESNAQVAELRYFGGLSIPDTAEALEMSVATVNRHWRAARAYLYTELSSMS